MSYPIQDVFLKYHDTAIAQYPVDGFIHKTVSAIMKCKTPALGGNVSICQDCGYLEVHYNSCRNRHCPCCQGLVVIVNEKPAKKGKKIHHFKLKEFNVYRVFLSALSS